MSELRGLARKLALTNNKGFPDDYQIHGYFATQCSENGLAAKLLNRLLNRRHARAIEKSRSLRKCENLLTYWQFSLGCGDIPGPYWAIMTHPSATQSLGETMFADVHMLSHLVGASNRADVRRLQHIEKENLALREKAADDHRRLLERIEKKDREIANLSAVNLKPYCEPLLREESSASKRIETLGRKLATAQQSISNLVEVLNAREGAIRDKDFRIAETTEQSIHLQRELNSVLGMLGEDNQENIHGLNLQDQCLLYVGGNPQSAHRIRALVEDSNGTFIYHDGGVEKSMNELASAVTRSDVVLFPTDCVSHQATIKVKRLCRQSQKLVVPLRTSGIASFVDGLQSVFGYGNGARAETDINVKGAAQ